MSEFYVYDGAARVGILEHWSSVQWLEQYASGGEAKIVAMATPQNVALLAVGRALYNPETGTAAHILSQQIDDKGTSPTITLRGAVGAARLAALGHGDFPDPYGVAGGQMKKCYEPHMSEDQRQHLLSQWERAVQRAMHWAQ